MTTYLSTTPAIAFLGTGRMGAPMAANLARSGFAVRAWNRTASHAAPFARQLGLDPAAIADLLQSTPLGSPYAAQKAGLMLAGDFTPAFALKHALKDAELAAVAARASGAELTLTQALQARDPAVPADPPAGDGPRRRLGGRRLSTQAHQVSRQSACGQARVSQSRRCRHWVGWMSSVPLIGV